MGRFRDHRIPDYNPFWEEKIYEDEDDYWHWYHLGYQEGWTVANEDTESRQVLKQRIAQLEDLLSANVRVMKAEIKKEMGL